MMKRWISLLILAGLFLVLAGTASALTSKPVMPELLHDLVAGKTFKARMEGYATDEEMKNVTLYFSVYEQESYLADEVENLAVGDTIVIGGDDFVIRKIETDETGYKMTGLYTIYLSKNDKGMYTAITDTENRFYKNVFSFEVQAAPDFKFLDSGDPEAEKPVELTIKELIDRYSDEQLNSMEENTVITFDDDGLVKQLEYLYTPWN
ncbi:MAG: hypothetical protein J6B53_01535 [Clostridia bacterium]|nr:hypothetical protein [Clostridia bacterium]